MSDSRFRLSFDQCRAQLRERLREAAPSRIQLLCGPRQVGKTTLLLQLAEEIGAAATYVAADAAPAMLSGFWERTWAGAEEVAVRLGRAVVLLDEVHVQPAWAARLKAEWDRLKRRRLPVHVVAAGSSAMRLAEGSRESLAGRFERLTLAHWSASALASAFAMAEAEAVDVAVRLGTYPGSMELRRDPPRWQAYVRDAIVEPAIGRDLAGQASVRRPGLLRQIFAVAASSPAQVVSLQKIRGQLQDRGALETVSHYLALLEEAFLVAALEKHSARLARSRAAPPKLVVLNNALLAVLDPLGPPSAAGDPARFGRWVENACLAFAWNAGQQVRYWREEPLEVDAVLDGSWGRVAIEVKTGPYAPADLRGLLEFSRRHAGYRPVVLCDRGQEDVARRSGVDALPWGEFLLKGL